MIIMDESDSNNDSSYEDVSDNEENTNESEDVSGNLAWANSIANILKSNKPKKKKTLVLSKAKKFNDDNAKPAQKVDFEIQGEDGEVKREIVKNEAKEEIKKSIRRTIKKKPQLPKLRVKPNILDKDRERTLSKIATKGVVQLFNAVRTQQKDIDNQLKEAGPLEVKRDKVLKKIDKRSFLDMLMGETNTEASTGNTEQLKEGSGTWNVLRDDFMMKAKMKDWDKELEQNMEIEQENIESD